MPPARKPMIATTKRPTINTTPPQKVINLETGEVELVSTEEDDAQVTSKKKSSFEAIKALSSIRPLTYRDLVEQNLYYKPFMINRAFSLFEDAVVAASEMNQRPHLDKDVHASYYIHALRPRRRFEKWPKLLDDLDAKVIAQYYGMSMREAKLHLRLHTKEQVNMMRRVLEEGARPSRFR
jgi:hypothetical protein